MDTEMLEHAAARTRELMANVSPDMYGLPTPCQSWDVRALLNHIVAGANWVAHIVEVGVAPEADPYEQIDYVADDVLAADDAAIRAALDVLRQPAALDKRVKLPFGELKGSRLLDILVEDEVVHGWDLAKATGQTLTAVDEQLASNVLEALRERSLDAFRGPNGQAPYGPAVAVPESAPATERLAAFFGRTP